MKKENIIWFVVIAVVIVGVGIYLVLNPSPKAPAGPGEEIPTGEETPEGETPIAPAVGETEEAGEPEVPQWQQPEEPYQSEALKKEEIPAESIKITITASGISPSSFEVRRGQEIMLSIIGGDEWTHVFKFKDESLSDVAVGVGPEEIRAITFYAPSRAGEYEYYCDVPGHAARGETGKMIVK